MEKMSQNSENVKNIEQKEKREGRFINKLHKVLRAGVAAAVVGIATAPAQAQEAPSLGFENAPSYDSGSTPGNSTSSEYNYGGSAAGISYSDQDGKYILTPSTEKKPPLVVSDPVELTNNGGQDTTLQAEGANGREEKIRSALTKSAEGIKEWVEGGKTQPLIIEDPSALINTGARDQALGAFGGVGSVMGESVTQDPAKSQLSSELTEQILRSFSDTMEPSQILSLNEKLVMELEHVAIKGVQTEINQDLKEKLQLAKKGEVTLQFASLNPGTKKIFIRFASGDESSVEVPTMYLGNNDLLKELLIAVINKEVLQESIESGNSGSGSSLFTMAPDRAIEPSQFLTPEEISLMEQQKALVNAVQIDVNQSLHNQLAESGKGNITLQFASLNPVTKKIFIKFASGGEITLETSMTEFNNTQLLRDLVEASIKKEITLTPASK